VLSTGDEPVIDFPADVGASRRGALHGCNEMRIAWLGHNETSRSRMYCDMLLGAANEGPNKSRHVERMLEKKSEMNWLTVAGNELGPRE